MESILSDSIKEVETILWRIKLVYMIMNSVIVFFTSAIFLRLLNLPVSISVLPTLFYILAYITKEIKYGDSIKSIVIRYPKLDERLQTALDNRDKSNIIVKSLTSDVSNRLDEMRCSSFIETKTITKQVILVILLISVFLSINFIRFDNLEIDMKHSGMINSFTNTENFGSLLDRESKWQIGNKSAPEERERIGAEGGGKRPGIAEGPEPGMGGGAGDNPNIDIYGKKSSAKIEGENINIELHPEFSGEIEIGDVEDKTKNRGEFSISSIESAGAPRQEPLKYEEIIKKYFEKLVIEGEE